MEKGYFFSNYLNHFSRDQKEKVSLYLELIHNWNPILNLVSQKNDGLITYSLLLDTIYIMNFVDIKNKKCVDVGSGSGIIGIPLALLIPECQILLVERSLKKAVFLREAVARLKLSNVEISSDQWKNIVEQEKSHFDIIISRGVKQEIIFGKQNQIVRLMKPESKIIHITKSKTAKKSNLSFRYEKKIYTNQINKRPTIFEIIQTNTMI